MMIITKSIILHIHNMTISFSLNGTSPIWMRQKVRSRIQDPVIACVTDQSKITCTKVAYIMLKYIQKNLMKKESKRA